jgi:hypothetical protein
MPRTKRRKPQDTVHDRRLQDLPYNAKVASIEVDDPYGTESGDKIVALRSIRTDVLAKLHTHRQIDEAQYRGAAPSRMTGRRPNAARAQSTRPAKRSMAGNRASRSRKPSARRCFGSAASNAN